MKDLETIDTSKQCSHLFLHDKQFLSKDCKFIAGMDEVGRGPLAGPVVVACVVMPLDNDKIINGINDSKKLTQKKRDELYDKITSTAIQCIVYTADNNQIDKLNILNATKWCMLNCINDLQNCDLVLVDAVKFVDTKIPTHSIIKGDAKSYSIAAASIVAKVVRDRFMQQQAKIYPEYFFDQNKGYGTAKHIGALKQFGPCPIHRKTFIKNFFAPKQESFFD